MEIGERQFLSRNGALAQRRYDGLVLWYLYPKPVSLSHYPAINSVDFGSGTTLAIGTHG